MARLIRWADFPLSHKSVLAVRPQRMGYLPHSPIGPRAPVGRRVIPLEAALVRRDVPMGVARCDRARPVPFDLWNLPVTVFIHPLALAKSPASVAAAAHGVKVDLQLADLLQRSFAAASADPYRLAMAFRRRAAAAGKLPPRISSLGLEPALNLIQTVATLVAVFHQPDRVRVVIRDVGDRLSEFDVALADRAVMRDVTIQSLADATGATWTPTLATEWSLAIDLLADIYRDTARATQPKRG